MPEDKQLELVTVEVDGQPVELIAQAAKHSGRYICERNPKLAQLIVESLRYGVPAEVIHKATGVHEHAIAFIDRKAENLSMEDHKRELLHGLRNVSLGAVRLIQSWIDAGDLDPKQLQALAVTLGISTEKLALLEGSPTHRVEVTETPAMQIIRRAIQSQGMVLPATNNEQTRLAAASPEIIDVTAIPRNTETPVEST